MRNLRRIAVLAAVMALSVPATAAAAPRLSMALARKAVASYEAIYWAGQGEQQPVTIERCQRRSTTRITCYASLRRGMDTITSLDRVQLLSHGVVRVHPMFTEEVLVLDG